MKIENVKRVNLTELEAQKIQNVLKMIEDIAEEFDDYTQCEVFDTFLGYYYREGYVPTEIDFLRE